ncbi:MAG: nitrilase-related carbon-nitrogen hydrolase [Candidatus Thorarchaeota archaeon]|jgi:predicted amidohydrolase
MKLQLTLVQMPFVEGNREANYEWARGLLQNHKSSENLEFIVLPELFDVGFRYEDYAKVGPGIPGRTSEFVQDLAEEYSSYVVGTGLEKTEALFFNTLVMASPEGKIIGTYRKIHPFQSERDVFAGGSTATLFDIKGVKIGVEICYDIRFPEVSRKLALEGAELILMPSAFPDPRSAHWDNLVMARAIENQLFMAAANRVGPSFDGKTYFGHSQVVDAWGVRLTRINSENEIFTSRVDTSMIQTVREQITCYADIAPEGYNKAQWFRE